MTTKEQAAARIQWVSRWLDANIGKRSRGKVDEGIGLDALRLIKLMEECGEVVTNFIRYRNLNPRKAVANPKDTGTEDDIVKELFDVAFTAVGAAEHFLGNNGAALDRFLEHVASVKSRLSHVPEPHYYTGAGAACQATGDLWDGTCGRWPVAKPLPEGVPPLDVVHLDPKPWFVEEAVQEPGHADLVPHDGRYSYEYWLSSNSDTFDALAVWKPRFGYVQEQESYRA